jgi:hypothetical protein
MQRLDLLKPARSVLNRGVGRPSMMPARHPILRIHVRPARSIFCNALNLRCSQIAACVRSP